MQQNKGRVIYLFNLGLSTIMALIAIVRVFTIYVNTWGTHEYVFSGTLAWLNVFVYLGLPLLANLIPLLFFSYIARISYIFISRHKVGSFRSQTAAFLLNVLMFCMVPLSVATYVVSLQGGEPLAFGIFSELLGIIALFPFLVYHNDYKEGKKLEGTIQ